MSLFLSYTAQSIEQSMMFDTGVGNWRCLWHSSGDQWNRRGPCSTMWARVADGRWTTEYQMDRRWLTTPGPCQCSYRESRCLWPNWWWMPRTRKSWLYFWKNKHLQHCMLTLLLFTSHKALQLSVGITCLMHTLVKWWMHIKLSLACIGLYGI